jgi:hypothetical protein
MTQLLRRESATSKHTARQRSVIVPHVMLNTRAARDDEYRAAYEALQLPHPNGADSRA